MGLVLKSREFIKFMEQQGYGLIRSTGGSHHIYSNGVRTLPIPIHPNKDFNEDFIRKLLREAGIDKKELLNYLGR
ncbi:MAG: type II toxin-antitoxin system HicA family toxin [Defluviitaleaceae bacterium]|nr:type II toxin-antitoxin system HicA family toxin [Defluviitaleaceae bacterium]